MKLFLYFWCLVLAVHGCAVALATDPEVIVYTENYEPYNYADDEGRAAGVATENVRQILDASGLRYEIRVVSWRDAINGVGASPNALIFSITRVPSREPNYNWLVLLAPSSFFVYVRGDDPRQITIADIQAGKYTAACVETDVTCEILLQAGLPQNKLQVVPGPDTGDFLLVHRSEADIFVSEYAANKRYRKRDGFPEHATKVALRIGKTTGFFLAGGKNLSSNVRDRILDGYQSLLTSGKYNLVEVVED